MRRSSAGEGGRYKVVDGSFMFVLSAVAVESEIVGRDTDAGLIEDEYCWGLSAAASRAAVAVCPSGFFGAKGKYDEKRFPREVVGRAPGLFSLATGVEGVELVKGIENRRGIVDKVQSSDVGNIVYIEVSLERRKDLNVVAASQCASWRKSRRSRLETAQLTLPAADASVQNDKAYSTTRKDFRLLLE